MRFSRIYGKLIIISCFPLSCAPTDSLRPLLQAHQQQRKAASSSSKATAPRFERLMARLDLSDKEQLAMLYVLVKQVSQEDLSNLVPKYGRSSPSFAALAKLVSTDGHHRDTL